MVDVLRVRALDGRRLSLRFSDGREGEYNCAHLFEKDGPMVQPLKDPAFFARVSSRKARPLGPTALISTQSHSTCACATRERCERRK